MVFYERGLEDDSTESKIIEFDFDFAEKLKIEEGYFLKIRRTKLPKNKDEIKLNYDSKQKSNDKR